MYLQIIEQVNKELSLLYVNKNSESIALVFNKFQIICTQEEAKQLVKSIQKKIDNWVEKEESE